MVPSPGGIFTSIAIRASINPFAANHPTPANRTPNFHNLILFIQVFITHSNHNSKGLKILLFPLCQIDYLPSMNKYFSVTIWNPGRQTFIA